MLFTCTPFCPCRLYIDKKTQNYLSTEFPKLVALRGEISKGDIRGGVASWVSFGTNSALYGLARSLAQSCNQAMTRIFCEIGKEANVQTRQTVQQDFEVDTTLLV